MPYPMPVPIENVRGPSRQLQRFNQGQVTNRNFADGVTDSFPRLSIRGKEFRVRFNQQEFPVGDYDRDRGHILDIVLVNAGQLLAKSYYVGAYQSGDMDQPDCWSLDSIRPDPSIPVQRRQELGTGPNGLCATCPKNAFGSAPSGRGGKACQDSRRVVITTTADLASAEPALTMMRTPQQSLKNMKNYVEYLAKYGFEPGGCVTRLSFDRDVEYPKLMFQFVGPLSDVEFDRVCDLVDGTRVKDMLRLPDFDNAASNANTPSGYQQQAAPPPQQQGFGAGMLDQLDRGTPPVDERAFVQQTQPPAQQQATPVQQPVEEWIDTGDGNELNTATGEIRALPKKTAEPERDPNVIAASDGRFFNRALGRFVDSPYVGGKPVVSTPQQQATGGAGEATKPPAEKDISQAKPLAKRTRKAAAKPSEAKPPVGEESGQGNGQEDGQPGEPNGGPQPIVVPASPKLEQLLGGLVKQPGQA